MANGIDCRGDLCYTVSRETLAGNAGFSKRWRKDGQMIDHIEIRGARVHNLKNVDVDIPLGKIVGVAGVSGSGKSSLALGVLYAEGSRPLSGGALHLHAAADDAGRREAQVDEALYMVPAALALHQRPGRAGHPQHVRHRHGTV